MRIYVAIATVFAAPGVAFPGPVSELDLHDVFATTLACEFIEKDERRGLPEINLSARQLADAAAAYKPGQSLSEADVELFRWRARMPEECGLYDALDQQFGAYAIGELLSMVNEAAGVAISWQDITDQASADSCKRSEAFWEGLANEGMDPIGDKLDRLLRAHPVFGDDNDPAGLSGLKIRWRAYWLGRYRERELSDQAVEDYAAAFEAFPEDGNRYELNFDEIALPLFYTSSEFSAARLAAFGSVSPGGDRGLDLQSYISRQQAWNFLFSGETDFPVRAPDDDRALEFKEDVVRHFRGELPGPENCHPVDYWEVRGDYSSILHEVVAFVGEHLNRRLDELVQASPQPVHEHGESRDSVSAIVEPALAQWVGPDCAQPVERVTARSEPGSQSQTEEEPAILNVFYGVDDIGSGEILAWTTVEHGVPEAIRNAGVDLDADQAERIRNGDVVSELWRTTVVQVDLFELSWCKTGVRVPLLPSGYGVVVPFVAAEEQASLWSR